MSNTTPRHWKIAANVDGNDEESMGKWAVEDAFEGAGVEIGNTSIIISYKTAESADIKKMTLPSLDLESVQRYFGISLEENDLISSMVNSGGNGQNLTNATLDVGSLAIVRTPTDPLSRDYTDLLDLPTDASISTGALGNYKYTSNNMGQIGGEAIVTDKIYINLKALGYKEGDTVDLDTSAISRTIFRL